MFQALCTVRVIFPISFTTTPQHRHYLTYTYGETEAQRGKINITQIAGPGRDKSRMQTMSVTSKAHDLFSVWCLLFIFNSHTKVESLSLFCMWGDGRLEKSTLLSGRDDRKHKHTISLRLKAGKGAKINKSRRFSICFIFKKFEAALGERRYK